MENVALKDRNFMFMKSISEAAFMRKNTTLPFYIQIDLCKQSDSLEYFKTYEQLEKFEEHLSD